jgi:release factor glutamine methyltransferase
MNEIELLFTDILNCKRHDLYLNKYISLDKEKRRFLNQALMRRFNGEPIQYILGKAEFMGLEFKVNKDVFIPRPETEILVEAVINCVSPLARSCLPAGRCPVCPLKILEIGTGSGCIAISLAKFLQVNVIATDISNLALEVAKQNALLHNVDNKIKFIQGDLFTIYDLRITNYDTIVSNPPYIPSIDMKDLPLEVRNEPVLALDGGKDGIDIYRRIIKECPRYLKDNGYLIMEIGFGQCQTLKNIFKNSGKLEIIDIVRDYNNIERVIVAQKKKWIN